MHTCIIHTWYLLLLTHVHTETAWPLLLKHHHLCHIYWRIAMLMATLPIIPLTFIATLWGRVYYSPHFIGDKTEVHKDEAALPTSHWEVQRRLWTALILEATLCSKTTHHLPSQPEREKPLESPRSPRDLLQVKERQWETHSCGARVNYFCNGQSMVMWSGFWTGNTQRTLFLRNISGWTPVSSAFQATESSFSSILYINHELCFLPKP